MQIGILINDKDYRDALVAKLSEYDNDLYVNVISSSDPASKDSIILTDVSPEEIDSDSLLKIIPRTIFLTSSSVPESADPACHMIFKYSSVAGLLSDVSVVYQQWHGSGYGRDYSAKIIAVCGDNDALSYDNCMTLARQLIYRRGGKVLVLGLGYINDYGNENAGVVNRFARMMYEISNGRGDVIRNHTYKDSYGVSCLLLQRGRNPFAYISEEELTCVITSLASGFETLILDIGTCYRNENISVMNNSDRIIMFESGRRFIGLEEMLSSDSMKKIISVKYGGEAEDAIAIDDAINRIYGVYENEN